MKKSGKGMITSDAFLCVQSSVFHLELMTYSCYRLHDMMYVPSAAACDYRRSAAFQVLFAYQSFRSEADEPASLMFL